MDKVSTDQKSPAEIKRENAISKIHNDENTKLIKQALAIDIKDQKYNFNRLEV